MRNISIKTILLFPLLIALFPFISCSPPVSTGGGSYGFWAIPQRMVYNLYDSFKRETDLTVLSGGQRVPINKVKIVIFEDVNNQDYISPVNGEYKFSSPGQKIVSVSYGGENAQYSVDVRSPDNGGNGGNVIIGNGNGGGSGMGGDGIIWVYDRVISSRNIVIEVPRAGNVPQSSYINAQFKAAISWSPNDSHFQSGRVYTAAITVTPLQGYTLVGISPGHFTVNGSSPTTTNVLSSGIVRMVFPVVP